MLTVREKFNYLKGLADGLKLSDSTNEGKVLLGMLDLLDELTLQVEEMDNELYELEDYVEQIDSDLVDIEEDFYGFEHDYDYDLYDDDDFYSDEELVEVEEDEKE